MSEHDDWADRHELKPAPAQNTVETRCCTHNLKRRITNRSRRSAFGLHPFAGRETHHLACQIFGLNDYHSARSDDDVVYIPVPSQRQVVQHDEIVWQVGELGCDQLLTERSRGPCRCSLVHPSRSNQPDEHERSEDRTRGTTSPYGQPWSNPSTNHQNNGRDQNDCNQH
jgi:hypothetical protein